MSKCMCNLQKYICSFKFLRRDIILEKIYIDKSSLGQAIKIQKLESTNHN